MKRAINRALSSTTGYQLTRVPSADSARPVNTRKRSKAGDRVDRLVEQPVFILSSVRSGSTLLRMILNSHSQICAPHELHLRAMHVELRPVGEPSMKAIGLDQRSLEHLLWDRVLERELTASGKKIIVDKTPNTVFITDRLMEAWPAAKFIFLIRNPAGIADSLFRARKDPVMDDIIKRVLEYTDAIEKARVAYPGPLVRYEELVAEPEQVTKEICSFLDIPWEPSMINYGDFDHGDMVPKLGDWTQKIKSGRIDTDIVAPEGDAIPPELLDACKSWGYA